MHQTWKANSPFPLHSAWDVNPDCSKVTPSTQILPSLVGAHNNTLPNLPLLLPFLSCLSILFVYSAACLEHWLVHPHLLHSYPQTWHYQAATTVSSFTGLGWGLFLWSSSLNCYGGVVLFCLLLLILLVWTPSLIDDSCMFAPSIWTTILSWL